jgi:wobble nucleotide-excising tRNase
MLKRIDKIKKYYIFKDFSWSNNLAEFNKFNLIYGWNGSGKTTLSNLLRCVEKHRKMTEGECSIKIDDEIIPSYSFDTCTSLPMIRVFNREFIDENIFTDTGAVSPIFYLGKESIEKQKTLESLKSSLGKKQKKLDEQNNLKINVELEIDRFTKEKAKFIKELLRSSGSNSYNNYTKVHYVQRANQLTRFSDDQNIPLTSDQKSLYNRQKEAIPKQELAALTLPKIDLNSLIEKTNSLLNKKVISNVIEKLINSTYLSEWIQNGLDIHLKSSTDTCLFCGNQLPPGLLKRYKGHFNDELDKYIGEIESLYTEIDVFEKELNNIPFYNKAELYDHFSENYEDARQNAIVEIKKLIGILTELKIKLKEKKKSPFHKTSEFSKNALNTSKILSEINRIIERHNEETKNFQSVISNARTKLENAYVLESLDTHKQKIKKAETLKSEINKIEPDINQLNNEILSIEKQIVEHHTPAEELNKDLGSYLGHKELCFEVLDHGYRIMRNGSPATGLSEGEKTAIAFLYFLKSLNDKDFIIKDGIIVIDDPISSLDSNSLFCAFGFMQSRVKGAGQLIILTHNFPFFRQVKNWFHFESEKNVSFYMIESSYYEGNRRSTIIPLDKLLSKYDSEYHYLFKLVYLNAKKTEPNSSLEEFYHLPNIARRLLESFLSFKHPQKAGSGLYALIKELNLDEAKKSRIVRFLNTNSHEGNIDDPEHDMTVLSETPQILQDVMDLIEKCDKDHYNELVSLVR